MPETDQLISAVPWTQRRMVLVFVRTHNSRQFIRLRTFNKHRTKGCWYPSPRYFVVPIECGGDLARGIAAAAAGRQLGEVPEWYADFAKQYPGNSGKARDGKPPARYGKSRRPVQIGDLLDENGDLPDWLWAYLNQQTSEDH